MLTWERFKWRYWAVKEDGDLLCVTVCKKGALAVIDRIENGAPGRR